MRPRRAARIAAAEAPSALHPAPAVDSAPAEAPRDRTLWTYLNRPFGVGFLLTLGALVAISLGAAVTSLATIWIYVAFALFAGRDAKV